MAAEVRLKGELPDVQVPTAEENDVPEGVQVVVVAVALLDEVEDDELELEDDELELELEDVLIELEDDELELGVEVDAVDELADVVSSLLSSPPPQADSVSARISVVAASLVERCIVVSFVKGLRLSGVQPLLSLVCPAVTGRPDHACVAESM